MKKVDSRLGVVGLEEGVQEEDEIFGGSIGRRGDSADEKSDARHGECVGGE